MSREIKFYKYHGTGNDFILIDDRCKNFNQSERFISHLCHRQFGIGADGLILLQEDREMDFSMKYFNSDGQESSMCGNGGRCIAKFAHDLSLIDNLAVFRAIDGRHEAHVNEEIVELQMNSVKEYEEDNGDIIIDTGSPHFVRRVNELPSNELFFRQSREIRYSDRFETEGINVNFYQSIGIISSKTYERGVENETLSCGTGAVAVALAAHINGDIQQSKAVIKTPGGKLKVSFRPDQGGFDHIWLIGPAVKVFEGKLYEW
ncbi:MAG TPA: diaminopimelate epimerase [Flavobacteriales bacterium]|jgi:diaminopimelate epimerase|nr:diaminopimelate epimerase [Flavobacteriales bacterium]